MLDRVSYWRDYLGANENIDMQQRTREYTHTGRPGRTDDFLNKLERQTKRILRKGNLRQKVGWLK